MTLEEAQSLKPGDTIHIANQTRELTRVNVDGIYLLWDQPGNKGHRYEYSSGTIVKRAEPVVNNTYPIF